MTTTTTKRPSYEEFVTRFIHKAQELKATEFTGKDGKTVKGKGVNTVLTQIQGRNILDFLNHAYPEIATVTANNVWVNQTTGVTHTATLKGAAAIIFNLVKAGKIEGHPVRRGSYMIYLKGEMPKGSSNRSVSDSMLKELGFI